MTLKKTAEIICEEAQELLDAVSEFERISKKENRPARQGEGYVGGVYLGLPQSATRGSIIRKILTIRERLNVLRMNLNKAGSSWDF